MPDALYCNQQGTIVPSAKWSTNACTSDQRCDIFRNLREVLQCKMVTLSSLQCKMVTLSSLSSWLRTIHHQRDEIEALLLDSPSLRPRLAEASPQIYAKAVRDAACETGLAEDALPHECPYELDDMLAAGFLPD